jgi:acetyl esterase/lipase
MAEALAAHGFEVWLPEYRRVGDVGGGWPGSLDDVINATKFVRQETEQRPLLIGHSAGGHLALRAAQTDIPMAGVVGLAPIIDLVTYGAKDGSCQSMVAPFMGDETYAPNERYRDASVSLTEIQVPVHVILGHIDSIVGKDQVAGLAKDQLTMIPQSGHFDLIHPDTLAFSRMLSILEQMSKQKGTSK